MKNKIRQKCMGAVAVAAALIMGFTPMTAFAQADPDPECGCEIKCTEDSINPDCETCMADLAACEGVEPETETEEVYGPLTPDGNMTLVDDYGTVEAGGKQFITVVTKAGNYFYIIIDRDDQGEETVHFLNMVDESDLLSLMDDEEAQAYVEAMAADQEGSAETQSETVEETAAETEELESSEAESSETKAEAEKSNAGILVILMLVGIGGAGGFLYLKANKKKATKKNGPDPDADYMDDEEDYLDGIPDEDSFDEDGLSDEEESDTESKQENDEGE